MDYTFKDYTFHGARPDNEYDEYMAHVPYLYAHRARIYASADYFYVPLPLRIYGLRKATCIGALLRAYDRGEPYRTMSDDGRGEAFIATYAGNPMSGTTTGLKVTLADGMATVSRFRYCGFGALARRLAEGFHACDHPYREPQMTLHDLIQRLREEDERDEIHVDGRL